MWISFFLVFLVIGIALGFVQFNTSSRKLNKFMERFGFVSVLLAAFIVIWSMNTEMEIREREMIPISEEVVTYDLVSLRTDKEVSGHGSRYYIRVYENKVFDFYYKVTKNGIEGFEPETIVADDVFIAETYEGSPVIIETIVTYDYSLTPFEKFWFSGTITTEPITHTSYEIYVPEGSIVGEFDFT